jgi:hypothetical protein
MSAVWQAATASRRYLSQKGYIMPSSSNLRCSHHSDLASLLSALITVLAILGGCATHQRVTAPATRAPSPTATIAPTDTPTPHPVTAYTCAPGSLPIESGYTQIDCTIAPQGPYSVLHASYTGQGPNGPIDDPRLAADSWLVVDQTHGDSPYGAIGQALYFNQSAWFVVGYSYPASTMAVEQGIPLAGAAPIPCGQALITGTAEIQGIPTPSSMVSIGISTVSTSAGSIAGPYILVPACLQDVQQFYKTALAAAGWTLVQPFLPPPGSVTGSPVTTDTATVSHGTTILTLWLAGGEGTPTRITVESAL